jgi:hypothetical protein
LEKNVTHRPEKRPKTALLWVDLLSLPGVEFAFVPLFGKIRRNCIEKVTSSPVCEEL